MTHLLSATIALLLLATLPLKAQSVDSLRKTIERIATAKNATVGVVIMDKNGNDTISINGNKHLPMQSVFKFHIGLCMLSEIDKGNFSLDQKIKIAKKDLLPGLYSPIRDKYPKGATLTIAEILTYTVSQSDNVGCDVLLKLLGGPQAIEDYFTKNGFTDIAIKINEETMQNNWDLQFLNWTTAKSANRILKAFFDNSNQLLSQKSYDFIWQVMRETITGTNRLKGQLPAGTVVAHKTGTSGTQQKTGIAAATNDIGIVFLPNGDYFFISVLVANSKEDAATNERIIADIAKASWDYFNKR